MSLPVREGDVFPEKEGKVLPCENRQSTEDNIVSFSYNLARPLLRRHPDHLDSTLTIIEKGYEKSNPQERKAISYSTIRTALFQIREHVLRTPLYMCLTLMRSRNFHVYLKKEFIQITSSVKARGVAYTLLQLSDMQKRKGVIAISTGNFAYTLCYYGKKFEIPVTVVIPISISDEIVKMCRDHADSRATVLVHGNNMLEAHKMALYIAKRKGLFYLDGNDHPNMIIGQATLGLEIMEQIYDADAVVLPTLINGCGITMGVAAAIKSWDSNIKIIEVQPTVLNCSIQDIRKQTTSLHELEIPVNRYTTYIDFNGTRKSLIDKFIRVNEESIRAAANLLLATENIVDSYAAIGLAAFLTCQLNELTKQRVVIPLFGKMDFD